MKEKRRPNPPIWRKVLKLLLVLMVLVALGACLFMSPLIIFIGEDLIHSPSVQRVFDSFRHIGHVPVWIPKTSEHIAFVCLINADWSWRRNRLYTIQPDGSHLRDITIDDTKVHYDLDWSPDGEWLAFTLNYRNYAALMDEWSLDDYDEIHRIRYDGTESRRLTYSDSYESAPRWTRDGKDIVFLGGGYRSRLYRVSAQASGLRALTDFEAAEFDISPDRQKLAVVARVHEGEPQPVYLMNPDGSETEHLLTTDVNVSGIQWSPDNKRILYYAYNGLPAIYNIEAGREEPAPIIRIRSARWSPDNRWIAIIGGLDRYKVDDEWIDINGTSDEEISNSLHLYEILTGELKQLVDAADGHVSGASWSPDSQWLAFSQGLSKAQVYKVRIDGTELQQLTNMECSAYGVAWSPK